MTPRLPWPRSAADGTPLGVDLGRRRAGSKVIAAEEVRRLVASSLRRSGVPLELEDVVQEVCMAIVRRNRMRSAYDPREAGFAHYVWILCGNVVGHMLERRQRVRKERPAADLPELESEELGADGRYEAAEILHAPPSPLWAVALQARAVSGPQLELLLVGEEEPVTEPGPPAAPSSRQTPRGAAARQLDLFEVP